MAARKRQTRKATAKSELPEQSSSVKLQNAKQELAKMREETKKLAEQQKAEKEEIKKLKTAFSEIKTNVKDFEVAALTLDFDKMNASLEKCQTLNDALHLNMCDVFNSRVSAYKDDQ